MAKRATSRKRAAKRSSPKRKTTKARKPTKAAKRTKSATRAKPARRTKPTPKPSTAATVTTLVRGVAESAVAAVARRLPWSKNENDPIALLETDHRRFEELLKQGEETTVRAAGTRRQLLKALASELNVHEAIEEKILYPALKSHPEAKDIVLEGYQEHHVADLIINELRDLATDDERWGAKFSVLKESLEHHIQEEERQMFPTARGVFDRQQLNGLGSRMRVLKAELER